MSRMVSVATLAICFYVLVPGCAKPMPAVPVTTGSGTSSSSTAKSESVKSEPAKPEPAKKSAVEMTEAALETPTADGMNWLTKDEVADGWLRLYDGHTLFGWKSNNSKLNWSTKDGVITADSEDAANKGLLVTTTRFADYELRCDYRVAEQGNSGIFLRTLFDPSDPAKDCYELNMCDTRPEFGTGSLVKRIEPLKPIRGEGRWHTFHVRAEGTHIAASFDGEPVLDFTDNSDKPLRTGHIGLQMNGGKIEFRNVYLKPLGTKSLFDGQSLTGWRTVPGSKSEFVVQDQTIHVAKGPGFLETEPTAGNFVLQFDAITNGDKLNSGLFFRAKPGTEAAPSHGYEFQLHNGTKNGDRTQPDDHGTGAIFRRVSARRVVSNDREWLTATLIADGPHFSTWVNGVQVVDWTDERPDNENPREGRRLAAGHISLQGHDQTTDIAFRHLRLVATPD